MPTGKNLSVNVTQTLPYPTNLSDDYRPHYVNFTVTNNDNKEKEVELILKSGDAGNNTYPYGESKVKLTLQAGDSVEVCMQYAGLDASWTSDEF